MWPNINEAVLLYDMNLQYKAKLKRKKTLHRVLHLYDVYKNVRHMKRTCKIFDTTVYL